MLTQKFLGLALVGSEWIIWVLLLLSTFSLAVIFERSIVLYKKRGRIDRLKQDIGEAFQRGDYEQIEKILGQDPSSAAKVSFETIQSMKKIGFDFEESLLMALSEEKLLLESRTAVLGTLGSNAPFIGLFGTVLGIIHAFHSLAQNAKGNATVVMTGISEALVATALGLLVAIPAVIAYNYFIRSIKKIIVGAENFARLVVVAYMNRTKQKR
jgi:biopolymer transport protein ExbB